MKKLSPKDKTRAYILLEGLIALFIFLLLGTIISFRTIKIKEAQDLERAVLKISEILDIYTVKAMDIKGRYHISIDYSSKEIEIELEEKIVEKIKLPSKLSYSTPYEEKLLDKVVLDTTEEGNLSNARTIYIFNYSGKIRYRIATYTFQQNKLAKINIYKKMRGKEISMEDLLEYHKKIYDDEEVGYDWRKEG